MKLPRTRRQDDAVVISGASGRFPKSASLNDFRSNLFKGVDMVTADNQRWPVGLWNLPPKNGKMPNLDRFDEEFFGISEPEVNMIDPQERLLLELTYEAIIDAGVNPEDLRGTNTGYYFGSCFQESNSQFDDPSASITQPRSLITRTSAFFDFKGPVVQTDTACGSSFSVFCEAYNALKVGICDQAIVCGSNTIFRPRVSLQFRDLKMIARDGMSKCLDEDAHGYVRSEACVVFLLQKQQDARRIYCKILNGKSNSDGYKVEGITYPSIHGQRSLVSSVYEEANIDPNQITYIEAHVTGTTAGDPVEMNAMYDVICKNRSPSNPLFIGCLKSNMGHTEGASGLCAMAKACIIFQTRKIPPNLHYSKPNPNIKGLMDGTMVAVTKTIPFTGSLIPVNCFGFGGANAHVLAQSYDNITDSVEIANPIPRIIQVCGRTTQSVKFVVENLKQSPEEYLNNNFLSLLNDFATIPSQDGMSMRSYAIVQGKRSRYCFETAEPQIVTFKKVTIFFPGPSECEENFLLMQKIPLVSNTIKKLKEILNVQVQGGLNGSNGNRSRVILQSVGLQLAMADVAISLQIQPQVIKAAGFGCIAAAYFDHAITIEQSILIAYHASKNHSKDKLMEKLEEIILFPKAFSDKFRHPSIFSKSLASPEFFSQVTASISTPEPPLTPSDDILIEAGPSGFGVISAVPVPESLLVTPITKSQCVIMNLLHAIGKLYMNGSNCKVDRLYPEVVHPLPSSTPNLASLIKWKHDKLYPLDPFLVQCTSYHFQTSRTINYHFERRNPEDVFLYDHKIDGRVLFPATGYLMLAWIAYAKLNNTEYDIPVEFRDVSFERATVLSGSEFDLSCRINEDSGSFLIKDGDNLVAKGFVRFHNLQYNEPIAARLTPIPDDLVTMPAKDIYREFRIRGYDYGQYFQGLSETRSDGRSGLLVWREVLSKSLKEGLNLESDDDHSLLWLRSWTTFSDAMFQLLLMSQKEMNRNLFVPRKLESLICYPQMLKETINSSPQYMDSLTLNTASDVTAYSDPDENIVWVRGMIIKGLKTSLLKRRQQYVRHKKYVYMPLIENVTIDSEIDIKRVQDYHQDCLNMAKKLNRLSSRKRSKIPEINHQNSINEDVNCFATKCDVDDEKHSFLKLLCTRLRSDEILENERTSSLISPPPSQTFDVNNNSVVEFNLEKDLLIGNALEDWYYPEHFLKPHLEFVVYDMITEGSAKIEVLEISSTNHLLSPILQSFADESLLYDQTVLTYTLYHPSPIDLDPRHTAALQKVVQFNPSTLESLEPPAAHLLVFNCNESITRGQFDKLLESFYKTSFESSFLLIITKDKYRNEPEIEQVMRLLGVESSESSLSSQQIIDSCVSKGYMLVAHKTLCGEILPIHSILFKKSPPYQIEKIMTLSVGLTDVESWFEDAKVKLRKLREDPEVSLWVVPDNSLTRDSNNNSPQNQMNGLLGFVKSMRQEAGYSRVRCLIDLTTTESINVFDKKYGNMLTKDLVYNIWGGEKIGWLQFEHLCLPRQVHEDINVKSSMEHVYLKIMKPGDLTSFAWAQTNLENVERSKLVDVHYASLNFRDIMFATGRLQPEAIPGIPPNIAQDSILGLEFSGKDVHGNGVMGLVPYKAIASTVVASDDDLTWPIPSHWTMDDAATVPCVYATAYYALVVRGCMTPQESVLIHSGAGGVGLAAITICLSMGCKVYTTVGSQEKRDFLLKHFPQLRNGDIFYSRDTTFEDGILRATNGYGVDLILNSLAEEKLQASLRCLATNGRFLEIGKVDFIQDTQLLSEQTDGNKTFHGVLLDSLFKYSENDHVPDRLINEKKRLKTLVLQGIRDGTVRPLRRTIFEKEEIEDAFRYMSAGKHIGKVVIKIKQDSSTQPMFPAIKVTYCSPTKSYIVIGGLGGFGLEVVNWLADRGARKIVISARRPVRDAYQQFCLNRLKRRGVHLLVAHDIAHTHAGAENIITKATQLGPVGGIFNVAVVYDDILFDDMKVEQFQRVLEPKVMASLHFDELSRRLCPELDHFVLFSSISCGRGNAGQTNYNLANSAMDSICESRFAQGFPGLSIEWGVVGDVGIVTERTGSTEVNLLGATSQRLHSLLESLDRFMQSNLPVCLSYVKAEKAGNSSSDSVDLLKMVSRIFGIKDISTLDPQTTLGSLGIDSLIAVEMKQLLERVTCTAMSVKEIRDLTIAALFEFSRKTIK